VVISFKSRLIEPVWTRLPSRFKSHWNRQCIMYSRC